MPPDIHSDQRFGIFTQQEREFLADVFTRHPKIEKNFKRYLDAPPPHRPFMALFDLSDLSRTGWVKRGIKNVETVRQHSSFVMYYTVLYAPDDIDITRTVSLAVVHDLSEAIITDFTPGDKITPQDKAMLETLAVKTITQFDPDRCREMLELTREYAEQKTPESRWVRDVDLIDPCFVALQYEARYPEKTGLFKEFADYTKPLPKTARGQEIFGELLQNADLFRENYRDHFRSSPER